MPTVAEQAMEAPVVAANSAQVPILVCRSRPGSRCSQMARASYMVSAIPERSKSSPMRMNNGMAVSVCEFCMPQMTLPAE